MNLEGLDGYLAGHPVLLSLLRKLGASALSLLLVMILLRALASARDRLSMRLRLNGATSDASIAERNQRLETMVRVGFGVVRIGLLGFVFVTVLGEFGVSIQPLVAGASIAGAAVALGSQTVIKDFVSGCFILFEGQFVIGDVITISPTLQGTVERMTLRLTVLRDADGAVHVIPNGSITAVTNRTYRWSQSSLTIGVSAAADPALVRAALGKVALAVAAREEAKSVLLAEVVVAGPINLRGTTVDWGLSVKTHVGDGARVKSWLIEDTLRELQVAGIQITA
jgi:small conductance mechanosensitive channel